MKTAQWAHDSSKKERKCYYCNEVIPARQVVPVRYEFTEKGVRADFCCLDCYDPDEALEKP